MRVNQSLVQKVPDGLSAMFLPVRMLPHLISSRRPACAQITYSGQYWRLSSSGATPARFATIRVFAPEDAQRHGSMGRPDLDPLSPQSSPDESDPTV
jgi:hypothetical protein